MYKKLFILVLVIALLFWLKIFITYVPFYLLKQHEEFSQDQQDKYWSKLQSDHRWLIKSQLFPTPQFKENGGAYINNQILWVSSNGELIKPTVLILDLPEDVIDNLKSWGEGIGWVKHFNELSYEEIDLKWMTELLRYDHWNLNLDSPIEEYFESASNYPFSVPMPKLDLLLQFVKVRLMYGLSVNNTLRASKEIRHLAQLFSTTGYLSMEIAALKILKFEQIAHRYAKKNKLSLKGIRQWNPAQDDFLENARIALISLVDYVGFFTKPKYISQITKGVNEYIGLCAAIREAMLLAVASKPYLLTEIYGDDFYYTRYGQMDQLIAATSNVCIDDPLRDHWRKPINLKIPSFWKFPFTPKKPTNRAKWLAAYLFYSPQIDPYKINTSIDHKNVNILTEIINYFPLWLKKSLAEFAHYLGAESYISNSR